MRTALLLVGWASRALADGEASPGSPPPSPWTRRLALHAHLAGTGGPVGLIGGTLDYTPHPVMSVEAGAGMGVAGAQLALMSGLRPVRGRDVAWTLGAGPSIGRYRPLHIAFTGGDSPDTSYKPVVERALWLNLESGVEVRADGGFSFRIVGGYSHLLNPGDARCDGFGSGACQPISRDGAVSDVALLYVDMALGFGFD